MWFCLKVHFPKPQEVSMLETFADCVQAIKDGGKADSLWPSVAVLTQKVLCAVLESAQQGCKEVTLSLT